jgi:glycosyltransferase involved in cell wall biosynthesis
MQSNNNTKGEVFFSILIATYNVRDELISCVQSINCQTFSDYEVLIADGKSVDGTDEYIRSGVIKRLTWHKSEPDNGIYYALNEATDHALGKWILVMGADDRLADSDALNRAFQQITLKQLTQGIAYADLLISRGAGVGLKKYPEIGEFRRKYKGGAFIHHQSAFIARDSLLRAGKFAVTYLVHSDYDVMLTIQKANDAVKINGAFVVFNADGYSSKLSNLWLSFCEIYRIRKLHRLYPMPLRLFLLYCKTLVLRLISF